MSKQSFPVAIVVRREEIEGAFWRVPQWRVESVFSGEVACTDSGVTASVIERSDGLLRVLWRGLQLPLYKDECASYWVNLVSDAPALYVVCAEDEDCDNEDEAYWPAFVSADYDEACAYFEGEEAVCRCPMPSDIAEGIEAFVLTHYRPEKFEKRKRKNWKAEHA